MTTLTATPSNYTSLNFSSLHGGATVQYDSSFFKQQEMALLTFYQQSQIIEFSQWETWDAFLGWVKQAEGLHHTNQGLKKSKRPLPQALILAIQTFEPLYQNLKDYTRFQSLEFPLEQFLIRYGQGQLITYLEYQSCRQVYSRLNEWVLSIKEHWVSSLEWKAYRFQTIYQQLEKHIYWQPYEEILSSIFRPSHYLSKQDLKGFQAHYQHLLAEWDQLSAVMPQALQLKQQEAKQFLTQVEAVREQLNQAFLFQANREYDALLSNIDGKSLDIQQRLAVLSNEDQTVVLAGAGSGKTLTIAAKVKYLVDVLKVDPSRILLMGFTNKAAEEMKERIQSKLSIGVDVKTFHKLGLDLIGRYRHQKPTVINEHELSRLIESYLIESIFPNPEWSRLLVQHFPTYLGYGENQSLEGTLRDYYEFRLIQKLKGLKLESFNDVEALALKLSDGKRTLQQEYVKSMEEMKIANYLYLNGIRYEYESDYPYETADSSHRQYKPDFFLPDYDLYLEHFGVRQDGQANWLPAQKAAEYAEGIEWKRSIHRQHKTKMIETYSYQEKNQTLLKELRAKLEQEGVPFQYISPFDLLKRLLLVERHEFSYFIQLIETFISFFKGNLNTLEDLREWTAQETDERTRCFYELVLPLFEQYEQLLKERHEVDFNDMIFQAIEAVQTDDSLVNYQYIIVDEYQDISFARFQLLEAIRQSTQAKLFCVGDDWQSIYRFAGSDLSLFNRTADQGYILRLEQTYRNPQRLIDIAGQFVMRNPAQHQKQLKSACPLKESQPIQLYQYDKQGVKALKQALNDIVREYGPEESIFLLGRYGRDLQLLDQDFSVFEENGVMNIVYQAYPLLKIQFLTIHKSKGLEADHAILLNLRNSKMGFPSQIQDDPILSQLLATQEPFPHAEERRLFYVALTRAKKTCRLLVPQKKPSCFVQELRELFNLPFKGMDQSFYSNGLVAPVQPRPIAK